MATAGRGEGGGR
jgi:hypothetical protein